MKIYVILRYTDLNTTIIGVYDTRDKASKAILDDPTNHVEFDIEEWDVTTNSTKVYIVLKHTDLNTAVITVAPSSEIAQNVILQAPKEKCQWECQAWIINKD